MPRKRRTKKQIAAAEAARVRMQKYWAEKNAENADQGKWDSWVVDAINSIESICQKVYMAGWKQNKQPTISVDNQMSVADARVAIERILKTWEA